MNFEIKPYIGAGKILLGMTSEQIQKVMGSKPDKFKKSLDDVYDTEKFACFFAYYKSPGICEAIEFFGEADVIFNGESMIGRPYADVEAMFKKVDNVLELDGAGLTSYKYGVGIYASAAKKEPLEPVEAVIVFEKGYYD
jgi:hypothetical protein